MKYIRTFLFFRPLTKVRGLFFIVLFLYSFKLNAQWSEVGAGSSIGGDIMALMEHNNILYAGGTAYLFRSTDSGITWSGLFDLFAYAWSLAKSNNNLYCGLFTSSGQTASVYKSTNNGSDWLPTAIAENIISLAASDSEIYTSTSSGKIFLTTDEGVTWNQISNVFGYLFLSGSRLYAAGSGLKVTTDKGNSWSLIHSNPGISVFAEDSIVFFGTQYGEIFRSSDYGQTWLQVLHKPGAYVRSLFKYFDFVAAGTDSGLYISNDNGFNFAYRNDNLGRTMVTDIMYYDGYIYLSNGNYAGVPVAVWKRPVSELTSVYNIHSSPPYEITLMQNYPNPFNPSTKIRYSIPNTGTGLTRSVLKVYDTLGNEVATLVDDYREAGRYEIEFNSSDLPSGIYYYKLTAGNFSDVKKMILLK